VRAGEVLYVPRGCAPHAARVHAHVLSVLLPIMVDTHAVPLPGVTCCAGNTFLLSACISHLPCPVPFITHHWHTHPSPPLGSWPSPQLVALCAQPGGDGGSHSELRQPLRTRHCPVLPVQPQHGACLGVQCPGTVCDAHTYCMARQGVQQPCSPAALQPCMHASLLLSPLAVHRHLCPCDCAQQYSHLDASFVRPDHQTLCHLLPPLFAVQACMTVLWQRCAKIGLMCGWSMRRVLLPQPHAARRSHGLLNSSGSQTPAVLELCQ
jgi:hypothetical protein